MAENDEVSGRDFADTPYVPSGPRRSTFTPPSGKFPPTFLQPAEAPDERSSEPSPTAEPPSPSTEPAANTVDSTAGETTTEPVVGLPERPTRRSLQDDELVQALSPEVEKPTSTLDAIEQLQAELHLRERDAAEFSAWEERMRAIGTPEALDSIAQAIPEFTGVIPIITPEMLHSAEPVGPAPTAETGPAPAVEAVPEPSVEAVAEADRGEGNADVAPDAAKTRPDAQPSSWAPPAPGVPGAPFAPPAEIPDGSLVVPPPETGFAVPESDGSEVQRASGDSLDETPDVASSTPVEPPTMATPSDQKITESDATEPDATEAVPFLHPEQFPPPRLEERVDVGALPDPNLSDHLVFQPPWLRTPTDAAAANSAPIEEQVEDDGHQVEQPEHTEPEPEPAAQPEPVAEAQAPESVDEQPAESPSPAEVPEAPVIYELIDPIAPRPTSESSVTEVSPFDALLVGAPVADEADEGAEEPKPFSLLHAQSDAEPPQTGSLPIAGPMIDTEPDDDVDETDRAFGDAGAPFPLTAEDAAEASSTTGSAVVAPIATPRAAGETGAVATTPVKVPIFTVELSGEEATPAEHRTGRAARMFWLWFATNSSIVSVAFGAALFGLGMSLRQAILAAFIGVAISFLPLGLGTLAGKWSGQPTIVVSRATFGLAGNIVPALLAFVTRLFWGAVLLWLVAACTARILVGASLAGPFDEQQLTYLASVIGLAIALLLAYFGYPLFARVQLVLTIVSGVLIVGLLAVTWHAVDIRAALTVADGPWILVVTGVVLVFSFVGLVWANSSGDLARYQRASSSGASASLWASFGATLPAFLLIAYGALLAASNSATAGELRSAPLDAIALMIPTWYPVPLLAATVLSLLPGVALTVYSGGFALQAVGMRLRRQWSVVVVAIVMFAITVLIVLSAAGISGIFRDFATSLAVPVAAWAGIFAAEVMIRRRRFHEESLLRPGGVYPSVNWVNLVMLFVASAVGFAFTSATTGWLSWQGYGFTLMGFPLDGEVAGSDLGVLVALAIGLGTPLIAGVAAVRRQERAQQ